MAVKGNKIRGVTIEIGADTSDFIKSVKALDSSLKTTTNSLKDINKLLKLDPKNVELLAQKQQALTKVTDTLKQKQNELNNAIAKVEKDSDSYNALQRELIETTQKLNKYEDELKDTKKTINQTKQGTSELADETSQAGKKAEESSSKGWTVLKQVLADLATKVITAALDGIKKLGSALVDTGKQAISSYADYEQLAGGIKKLFGDAYKTVINNAEQAYKTAGMSVNQYIQGATSFSAALINSLDGDMDQAAELTEVAMRSIADNVNTYGVYSIENLQDVYKNLAKGTYSTLDNLLLGYGGTKEGMEQLIADANAYAEAIGQAGDMSIDSFADIIRAIELIQQKQGIAGTTAAEASSTISGSLKTVEAAWQNVLTAIADPEQDLQEVFDVFFEAVETFWDQLKPRIEAVIERLGVLINERIIPLLDKYLPIAIEYIASIIEKMSPIIADAVFAILTSIGDSFIGWIGEQLVIITKGLTDLIKVIVALGAIIIVKVIEILGNILSDIGKFFKELIEKSKTKLSELKDNIKESFEAAKENIATTIDNIKNKILGVWDDLKQRTAEKWDNIKQTIENKIQAAKDFVRNTIDQIKSFFNFNWELPHIKLPHFRISGSANPFDWFTQGIPRIEVDWYKKAQNQPYLFNSPSVIGVGDVPEVVVGADKFKQMTQGNNSIVNNITINAEINSDEDIRVLSNRIGDSIQQAVDRRVAVWR